MRGVLTWVTTRARRNAFLSVSIVLAALSCLLVPPSADYLDYLEGRTLVSLFCTLAVICALHEVGFFAAVAARVVRRFGSRRGLVLALVLVTLVLSLLITNDMALIVMLPLAWHVLRSTGDERHLALVFILMNTAANLGGMLTPFGSPQNLYLYSYFEIPTGEFVRVMAIPFAVSVVMITVGCLLVRDGPVVVTTEEPVSVPRWPTAAYVVLFVIAICIVLRVVPIWVGVAIPLVLLVMDRVALAKVDYGLMLTFVLFFVFTGNLAQVDAVGSVLTPLLRGDELVVGALASQVMSNVPAAILLAQFTDDYAPLLVGVNIGGVGTLVASLASLITLRHYERYQPGRTGSYVRTFTWLNVAMLVLLLVVMEAAFRLGLV